MHPKVRWCWPFLTRRRLGANNHPPPPALLGGQIRFFYKLRLNVLAGSAWPGRLHYLVAIGVEKRSDLGMIIAFIRFDLGLMWIDMIWVSFYYLGFDLDPVGRDLCRFDFGFIRI